MFTQLCQAWTLCNIENQTCELLESLCLATCRIVNCKIYVWICTPRQKYSKTFGQRCLGRFVATCIMSKPSLCGREGLSQMKAMCGDRQHQLMVDILPFSHQSIWSSKRPKREACLILVESGKQPMSDGCPFSGSNSIARQLTSSPCESTMSGLLSEDNQRFRQGSHFGSDASRLLLLSHPGITS